MLLYVYVQEKQRLCQMPLMAHQCRLAALDLHFIMGSGPMMDGRYWSVVFHKVIAYVQEKTDWFNLGPFTGFVGLTFLLCRAAY